jgi:hypothetical protein
MICSSDGVVLDFLEKTENLFTDMTQTIVYQSNDIFIDKSLETIPLVGIGQEHNANIFDENSRINI